MHTLLSSPLFCLSHALSWTSHLFFSLTHSLEVPISLSLSRTLLNSPSISLTLMHSLELPISLSLSHTFLNCPSLCLSHTLLNCPSLSCSLELPISLTHSWTPHLIHALLNFPSLCVFFPVTSHQCKCLLSMRTTTTESKHTLHVDAMFYGCSWLANMLWNAPDLLRCFGDVSDMEDIFFSQGSVVFCSVLSLTDVSKRILSFSFFQQRTSSDIWCAKTQPKDTPVNKPLLIRGEY